MAKKSSIQKNNYRQKLVNSFKNRRSKQKDIIMDKNTSPEDRFEAVLKLAKLKRNAASVRVRNRCEVTGRPRAYYRKLRMSRIALRDLASQGLIPGMKKSSW